MVIIFCREYENTIVKIIDWFTAMNIEYMIFTNNVEVNISSILNENEKKVYINNIDLDDINAVYYRNGEILPLIMHSKNSISNKLNKKINDFMYREWEVLRDFLFTYLKKKKIIGNYDLRFFNKIEQLLIAKDCGLKIPNTIIGIKGNDFESLFSQKKITKPLSDIFIFSDIDYQYSSYTQRLENSQLTNFDESFFPSLIQEEIEKMYELRIFFINQKLYPMAIFSFDNRIDVREGNLENEKRLVPYSLDNSLKLKLVKFIKKSKLNTGSIDMIVTPKKEFYFLEVNPCGQFGYLSKYCNYNIEKQIAFDLK